MSYFVTQYRRVTIAVCLGTTIINGSDTNIQQERYAQVVADWNTTSWQYGPYYKIADRKSLIDAAFQDIRQGTNPQNNNKQLFKQRAGQIMIALAKIKPQDNQQAQVIQSVQNYVGTTFLTPCAEIVTQSQKKPKDKASTEQQAKTDTTSQQQLVNQFFATYNDNLQTCLDASLNFWNDHTLDIEKLFTNETVKLSEKQHQLLHNASVLGDELQKYNHLEIFDTQYNILNVIVHRARDIANNSEQLTSLDTLQTKYSSYMQTLYHNVPQSYRAHRPSTLEQLQETCRKHKCFEPGTEGVLRLYKPITVQTRLQNISELYHRAIAFKNLQNYTMIHDVRAEGNCGWRATTTSVCINAIDTNNFAGIEKLKNLVQEQFVPLFTKYAGTEDNEYKLSVPEGYADDSILNLTNAEITSIQTTLLNHLESIKSYRSASQVTSLLNEHPSFDFFMIMFLRTIVAEGFLRPEQAESKITAAAARDLDEADYVKLLLRWTTWIDQPEFAMLHQATGININLITEQDEYYPLKQWASESPTGQADVLFVDDCHYQILQ